MTPPRSTESQAQGTAPTPATALASPPVGGTSSPRRPGRAPSIDYKKSFQSATDYWAFAQAILPAAKRGNAEAQYYLSRVMDQCETDNRMYFRRRGQILTLDAGLQWAAKRHLPIEVAQSVFDKCHDFLTGDLAELGSAPDWLVKATDAGQPLAEASTARKILLRDVFEEARKAGAVPDYRVNVKVGKVTDPRELLNEAVKSRDPEVMLTIGEIQGLLNPAGIQTNTTALAWWLVACQRGVDCSANAIWVKNVCAGDPACASATTQGEFVRILAGDNWPDVQRKSQEISAKLDAGKWDELELGSPPTSASN